jgi:hypothetical protein
VQAFMLAVHHNSLQETKILKSKIQNDKTKTGEIRSICLGAGCMSISANYGPAADKNQGQKQFGTHMKMA